MIKALLMLVRPVATWNGIAESNRSVSFVLLLFVLPLLVLTSFGEGYGLVHSGKYQTHMQSVLKKYTPQEAIVFEVGQTLLLLGIVFLAAAAVKAHAATFHTRTKFREAFNAIAYGFAPILSCRLLDMIPWLNAWVAWLIGLALTLAVLYHGLPCLLKPDPPHAMGLYFLSCLTVIVATGLLRFVVVFYWQGSLKGLEKFIQSVGGVAGS